MRALLIVFFLVVTFPVCYGQKFDVWINQQGSRWTTGKLNSFDETMINLDVKRKVLFLLPELTVPNTSFDWNEIGAIRIRNKTKHNMGQLLGTGIGLLAGIIILKGSKDRSGDFASGVAIPLGGAMAGMLAGHMLTSAKITIPLAGKTTREKSDTLRQKIAEISRTKNQ